MQVAWRNKLNKYKVETNNGNFDVTADGHEVSGNLVIFYNKVEKDEVSSSGFILETSTGPTEEPTIAFSLTNVIAIRFLEKK